MIVGKIDLNGEVESKTFMKSTLFWKKNVTSFLETPCSKEEEREEGTMIVLFLKALAFLK